MKRFDANCYLSLLDMMDGHDIGRGRNGTLEALKSIRQPVLAIGIVVKYSALRMYLNFID